MVADHARWGHTDCAFLFTDTLRPATLAQVETCTNQRRKYKNPYDLVWVIVIAVRYSPPLPLPFPYAIAPLLL